MFKKLTQKIASQLTSSENTDQKQKQQEQLIQLPADFHERQITCEIQLEKKNVSMEVIQELIDLYSQAVEFYGVNQDDRYLYYKNKMQELLMRTNVKKAMDQKTEEIRMNTEPEEDIDNLEQSEKQQQNENLKQQNIEKYGFLSSKNAGKYIEDVENSKILRKKIDFDKLCFTSPSKTQNGDVFDSIDNIKVKNFESQNEQLFDLNFEDETPVIENNNFENNENEDLIDMDFNDVQVQNNQKKQKNSNEEKDFDDDDEEGEREDIIFHTHNSSENTSDQKSFGNQKQFQVFSLNSQESPQNKLSKTPNGNSKFQIFKKGNNQNNNNNQLEKPKNKDKVFLTPNGNSTNQINLIDFNKEKIEAQQKLNNLITQEDEEDEDDQEQNNNNKNNSNNNNLMDQDIPQQKPRQSKTQSIIQQLLSPMKSSLSNNKQFSSQKKQQQQQQQQIQYQQQQLQQQQNSNSITKDEYSIQRELRQQQLQQQEIQKQKEEKRKIQKQQEEMQRQFQNADIQIINNGEVKKQKKQKSVKKSDSKKQRKPENETPSNFVIPF